MNCLILPCAGSLPIDMQAEFGAVPAACLPMGRSIALEMLLRPAIENYDLIYVAFPDDYPIVNALCAQISSKIKVLNVGSTRSVGRTVLEVLTKLPPEIFSVTVQAGDSHHPGKWIIEDSLGFSRDSVSNRWVTFALDEEQKIKDFYLPSADRDARDSLVFAGKFTVTDVQKFRGLLSKELHDTEAAQSAPGPTLFRALKSYFNAFAALPLIECNDWHDFGYLHSYHKLRTAMGFNERSFNLVEFDPKSRTVTKRSENKVKLAQEIAWYRQLPPQLQYAIPRVYDSSTQINDPWVKMEYVPAIPLDQIYLYSSCREDVWFSMLSSLKNFIDECKGAAFTPVPSPAQSRKFIDDMYSRKTLDRIALYENEMQYLEFRDEGCTVNGTVCLSLTEAKKVIREWTASNEFLTGYQHAVLHGDLCFSNILFDMRMDQVRVIDPRGSFGAPGVHGDLRYDFAKLYQSSHGHYDFLVNGYFDMRKCGARKFELNAMMNANQKRMADLVSRYVLRHSEMGKPELLFIEATLFLSMVPLHAGRSQSQMAFFLTGLASLSQAVALKQMHNEEQQRRLA